MTDVLWTAREAAAATGGQGERDWQARGLSIDTRSLRSGDLFVALQSTRDGHDFVARAFEAGAAAALVSRRPEGLDADLPLLVVDDVQRALEALAARARARTGARVVAVTGSVGKTTTKEMLRHALAGQGALHVAEASYNNHWGVPLTLARMPADTNFAVIEIGMSAPGEIEPLARLARPDVALITTVAPAHLAAFGNVAGIAREKATIAKGLGPDGLAILPAHVPDGIRAALDGEVAGRRLWFGLLPEDEAHVRALTETENGTAVQVRLPQGDAVMRIAAPGRHLALNALGALAAAVAAGGDLARSAAGIGRWTPVGGRGLRETVVLDPDRPDLSVTLIDDAFNANPASLAAALEVLALVPRGHGTRRVAVLGDMLELGASEERLHAAIARHAAMDAIDEVHCAGPRIRAAYDALPAARRGLWTETAEEMSAAIHTLLRPGDTVLVKGSKGARTALVVDAIRELGHRPRRQA